MDSALNRIQGHLTAAKELLNNLYVDAASEELQKFNTYYNQAALHSSVFEANDATTDQKREAIAHMRQAVAKMREAVDSLQSQTAETYRSQIGTQKETFEALSDIMQQQMNPEAFRSRMAFHSLAKLNEILSLLNGGLMDLNGNLEQAGRAAPMRPEGGATETFDKDPESSPLSP